MTIERHALVVGLVATAVLTVSLLLLHPFAHIRHTLVRVAGIGREGAAVENLWTDPETQEITNGQYPRSGLERLRAQWRQSPNVKRMVVIGNSQTMAIVLATDEEATRGLERAYPDIAFDALREHGHPVAGYRLAAPNLSYMEALFYVDYLLATADLRPARVVLQLNYEGFRKSGIRDGMLELLADDDFFRVAQEEARRPVAYAATFQSAIDRFLAREAKAGSAGGVSADATRTGLAESFGAGNRIESATRQRLAVFASWRARRQAKSDLVETLYLLRVYVLRITPTTRRSIGGATLAQNHSAIDRIGRLCRDNRIELIPFNAPANPLLPLYRTAEDRRRYHDLVSRFGGEYGTSYLDFENAIPQRDWGSGEDGPDPIHFGRSGHQLLAKLMVESGVFGWTD
jgi:hypothetical protein